MEKDIGEIKEKGRTLRIKIATFGIIVVLCLVTSVLLIYFNRTDYIWIPVIFGFLSIRSLK